MIAKKQIQKGLQAAAKSAENWNTKYKCEDNWRHTNGGLDIRLNMSIKKYHWEKWKGG